MSRVIGKLEGEFTCIVTDVVNNNVTDITCGKRKNKIFFEGYTSLFGIQRDITRSIEYTRPNRYSPIPERCFVSSEDYDREQREITEGIPENQRFKAPPIVTGQLPFQMRNPKKGFNVTMSGILLFTNVNVVEQYNNNTTGPLKIPVEGYTQCEGTSGNLFSFVSRNVDVVCRYVILITREGTLLSQLDLGSEVRLTHSDNSIVTLEYTVRLNPEIQGKDILEINTQYSNNGIRYDSTGNLTISVKPDTISFGNIFYNLYERYYSKIVSVTENKITMRLVPKSLWNDFNEYAQYISTKDSSNELLITVLNDDFSVTLSPMPMLDYDDILELPGIVFEMIIEYAKWDRINEAN